MKAQGSVIRYGANVDTDVIIPARYLNTADPAELARHCMEDLDASFLTRVKAGDIIVAEENFGCGSSREHAPIAIKAAGISAVVAKSFARIFYRNSINIGLAIIECAEAVDDAQDGDRLSVDLTSGEIMNLTKNKTYKTIAFPAFLQDIIAAGGLVEAVRRGIVK